jgi:membrane protease YdiL (CAAX protease family)
MNRRAIIFFALTYLFSWLLWLPAVLMTYGVVGEGSFLGEIAGPAGYLAGIGPTLVALILVARAGGKEGLKRLLARGVQFKLGRWYWALILIMPAVLILAHVLNSLLGGSFPKTGGLAQPYLIPPLFLILLIMQLGEEFGWRGFALDELQQNWGAVRASVVLGVLWSLWHIPMFLAKGFGHHDYRLPFGQLLITLVLVSILITWVQNNTGGSLIPAFVFHTFINLSGEVLPLIERNREVQGDYTAWIIANVLFAIVVVTVISRWGASTLTGRDRRPATG